MSNMTNYEWLLAMSGEERQAWFDAPHSDSSQVDELARDLQESERLREEMREELSIAYDYAHDLLARRDRGLA